MPPRPVPASTLALLVLTAVVALAGCQAGASPPPATPSGISTTKPLATAEPTPALTAAPSATAAPSMPSQTATEWGPIWDALPPQFPIPAQAQPVDPDEAVSAAFDMREPADVVATRLQATLEGERLSTESMSGPLEDGSFVIESVDPSNGCRVQTIIAPLGDRTRLVFRYGADCPFPMES